MIRVGINGFGRIGRMVLRIALQSKNIQIVHINDINTSVPNLAYLLKYDSIYGVLNSSVDTKNKEIIIDGEFINVSHNSDITKVDWRKSMVDVVVESSGVVSNHNTANGLINLGVKKVVITHSSEVVDKTIVYGVNEASYDHKNDNVLSSSICDTNAVAPLLKLVNDNFTIMSGNVTTLHPWLGYQNLSDGPCRSFAYPGELYENFSLGRASTESMLPKTTSCVSAAMHVVPELEGKLISMSFRTPTPIVSSAILTLQLNKKITKESFGLLLSEKISLQKKKIFSMNEEPLISKDFLRNDYSVIIDHRWTEVDISNNIRFVLWYDNEWGYSSRVVDLVRMIGL